MRADRVVVTGLGATSPVGGDVASTWESLLASRSGARRLPGDWAPDLPVQIAAPAAVDPATVLERVQARRLDRCEQLAIVAAREAWAHAGTPDVPPERLGVVVSTGIGGVASTLAAYDTLREKGWQRVSPFTVPMLMPNGAAGWISIELAARAGVHTTVSACASGAEAIGYAIEMIRSGRADVVVAGGTEAAIIPLNVAAFAAMRALSTRNDEPERASRPFDKGRDGFLLGEGAAILVLES
ncbi:MAG: beta-ketoacyl-ACP synthase, partial [Actinobacteria bacterium]|nr:beta-ketoacyl-ACP synthase [Actinomycetota bacterium]